MADETQQTQTTQTTTTDTNLRGDDGRYHYYLSDADLGGNILCEEVAVASKIERTSYPFVIEKPDEDIKTPVYDWTNYKWVDADGANLNARIAKVSDKLSGIESSISSLKAQAATSSTTTSELTESLNSMQSGISGISNMVSMLVAKVNASNNSTTTNNGGNN